MIDAKLVMFRSNGEPRDFPLNPETTCVGRKNDCDIRIPVTEVSRRHAEFKIKDEEVFVKDLGSSNGTYVNNKRVKQSSLSAGDHVVIGPVVFTLQIDGEPTELRPVKTKLKRHDSAGGSAQADLDPLPGEAAIEDELDPISALEALASSADQTAIDPFDDDDL